MNENTIVIASWVSIILLAIISGIAIQPHLIDDEFTVVIDDFGNTATFKYQTQIEPKHDLTETIYYKTSDEIIQISEKDEYNMPMFWIQNLEENLVWVLLPNGSGHLVAYVEDIENLKTDYIRIHDYNINNSKIWGDKNATIYYDWSSTRKINISFIDFS